MLRESNYGSLEKDERFDIIKTALINDIVREIKSYPDEQYDDFEGDFTLSLPTKYKTNDLIKKIQIKWKLDGWTSYDRTSICSDARVTYTHTKYQIVFKVIQQRGESIKDFKEKLISYFQNDVDSILLHEIKHILDDIDSLYDDTKYITPSKNQKKYYNQYQEKHNYLISIIADIKHLKKENSDYTFGEVVGLSQYYKDVVSFLPQTKVNKLNAKLADFWFKLYTK